MRRIQPHRAGLAFGALLATWHFFWAVLVAAGVAQALIDFIFNLHMITPPYHIAGFRFAMAAGLIAVTAGIGYISGFLAAVIWNRCMPHDAAA